MVVAQEVAEEEVCELRQLERTLESEELVTQLGPAGASAPGGEAVPSVAAAEAAPVAELPVTDADATAVCGELARAIKWWTGVEDYGCLLDIAQQLMPAEREEQLLRYRNRGCEQKLPAQNARRLVTPPFSRSKMEVAGAFDEHIRTVFGWAPGARLPHNGARTFLNAWDWGTLAPNPASYRGRLARKWHAVLRSVEAGIRSSGGSPSVRRSR